MRHRTVVVLAAGEGKRMKSQLPKVLHQVCGKSMLDHVLETAAEAGLQDRIVVVGHGAEQVKASLPAGVRSVLQAPLLGTGHAAQMAAPLLKEDSLVFLLYGDGPLIRPETLEAMAAFHEAGGYGGTILTTVLENPYGYGRIVREAGQFSRIVEEKDATPEERRISEINSGIYCFEGRHLLAVLPQLKNQNAQQEYYLTDVFQLMREAGIGVGLCLLEDPEELMAVNDRVQLAQVEAIMRRRINEKHMRNGVTIIHPEATYIGKEVTIQEDTVIYPGTLLSGRTRIGKGCHIGPDTQLEDAEIADSVTIQRSVIIDSSVGSETTVGPFAYLRPGSRVGRHAKVGDFVELKNASLGDHSKASHLAYIGDAQVGNHVNIGCGVVFVNYDGKKKHQTIVEDHSFIGSNVNLIAPVVVKQNAYVASGSTITDQVPEGALALARARQVNKLGWVSAKEKERAEQK